MSFAWATLNYIRSKYGLAHLSLASTQGQWAGREIRKGCLGSLGRRPVPWDGQGKSPWSSYLQWAPNPTGPLRLIYLQNDSHQSGMADDRQVKPPCAMSQSWLEASRVATMWLSPHKPSLIHLVWTVFSYLKGFDNAACERCRLFG